MPANPFIAAYIKELDRLYLTGLTTEHSFRPALQKLLENLCQCTVVNEQSHIDCGAPDLTLLRNNLPIAFVEAKNLEDGDLDGRRKNKEQFDRYKASLDTIIFTDYLDFKLYQHGEWVMSVHLAEIQGKHICLCDEARLLEMMDTIRQQTPQHITSAGKLAQLMAAKARLLRDIIENAIRNDQQQNKTPYESELLGYMQSFQDVLLHDITPKTFADIYAQTIAYGMFAARLHDTTPENFTRMEAANLIPKTNPFLRKVFHEIAGYDLDERIAWIVDDLVAVFAATDVEKIMQGFGKNTQMTDPLMHFYEDFLYQYDPAAKKACGVYYTPQPVVNYIVRAVDDILRTEFALPMGLADTCKVTVEQERLQDSRHRTDKVQKHRVQVLDPAVGTGTFLAEVVRQIKRNLAGQMGGWNAYVPEHLLPRLYGFELMMAPYTIAHLKLDMEIGVSAQERLKVFLTNSLEEYNPNAGTLFGNALSKEANAASAIKKEAPIMVMLGNPPYSGISQNNGEWIIRLMADYKKEPGGVQPLQERKIWLNDDYCKFIRLGQYYVDRNHEGILAYICNNGFLDNPTFRGMRWNLLQSFDKVYIINLHGNSLQKETTPDGGKDENVFDIMVGVSINIFVKTGKKKGNSADVYYADVFGTRKSKYDFLCEHTLDTLDWQKVNLSAPYYFFVPKDEKGKDEYDKGFRIDELMPLNVTGVVTARDSLAIDISKEELLKRMQFFTDKSISDDEVRTTLFGHKKAGKYLPGDSRGWNLSVARTKIQNANHQDAIKPILYRPFDKQYIYYSPDIVDWGREKLFAHLLHNGNFGIVFVRQAITDNWSHILVADSLIDNRYQYSNKSTAYISPLYLYPEEGSMDTERRLNLDEKIWAEISRCAGRDTTPEEVFDYIYGILHSPRYREQYKEFLKVDFPRIPYPESGEQFAHFVSFGHQLRELHLMHTLPDMPDIATFPIEGDCVVEQPHYTDGRVYINATQYFDNVPDTAWQFYIGGYQPAQKWLKDRKTRTLSFDDLAHYTHIIRVLLQTDRLMREIDKDE